MGIKTVAVFSDIDRNALHVQMADERVWIGSSEAKDSYLSIEKIIDACKQSGADAVHPGYGFLSENSIFCDSLNREGITFIGPSADAIKSMGDKIASKKIAIDAGVSTIPGFLGEIKDSREAIKIANKIGYPVMIKAAAGGGGKGMRIAQNQNEVLDGFTSSKNEAEKSFGDDRIFIEKYIDRPRHIEIQILGDTFGNYVFFGERECSIQRRNQKIIEEAPSVFISGNIRKKMGAQAIALAREVGYFSAGTVEFIVDADEKFYFLEMNTRLQVEHPVTELIFGVDLVEEMIIIASKKPISYSQSEINISGWAIECRIYAEDPLRSFLPSIGRLNRFLPPKEGSSDGFKIRNETGVYEGAEISIFYDPMIAKLCVWGSNRQLVIKKMQEVLDFFVIDGVQTNLGFLSAVMDSSRFKAGNFSTAFVSEEFPDGFRYSTPNERVSKNFAIVAACIQELQDSRINKSFSEHFVTSKRYINRITVVEDTQIGLSFCRKDIKTFIFEQGSSGELEVTIQWTPGQRIVSALIGGLEFILKVKIDRGSFIFEYRGVNAKVQVLTLREAQLLKFMIKRAPKDVSKLVLCPMPGLLVHIHVAVGDDVSIGDPLCIVEAMKMENILRSEKNGTVKAIKKDMGNSLGVDDVIIEFE